MCFDIVTVVVVAAAVHISAGLMKYTYSFLNRLCKILTKVAYLKGLVKGLN